MLSFYSRLIDFLRNVILSLRQRKSPKQALGHRGESLAKKHLRQKGLKIISRNWRHQHLELDFVAWEGNVLVFIEVKTRSLLEGNSAYHAVNKKKKAHLRRACTHYLRALPSKPKHYRFDVIEVGLMPNNTYTIQHHVHVPLFSKYFFVPNDSP